MKYLALIIVLGAVGGCQAPSEESPVPARFTFSQLESRFYYDLGADSVDVSAYPEKQKENYEVFSAVCSQCHTLARAINAPIITRKDWDRYVRRMHKRTLVHEWWTRFAKNDADKVLDFLAYDANVRKVKNKTHFEKESVKLRDFFQQVQKERGRLQLELDRKNVKAFPNFTSDKK